MTRAKATKSKVVCVGQKLQNLGLSSDGVYCVLKCNKNSGCKVFHTPMAVAKCMEACEWACIFEFWLIWAVQFWWCGAWLKRLLETMGADGGRAKKVNGFVWKWWNEVTTIKKEGQTAVGRVSKNKSPKGTLRTDLGLPLLALDTMLNERKYMHNIVKLYFRYTVESILYRQ